MCVLGDAAVCTQVNPISILPTLHPHLSSSHFPSHLTAGSEFLDVGAGVRAQLILVGPPELQGAIVGQPRARVGDVLVGGDTEQPQEGELDHAYRRALRVHIGELEERGCSQGQKWLGRAWTGNRKGAERNA